METPETIQPAPIAAIHDPKPVAAEMLPWMEDRALSATRLERPAETVHWSIALLTAVTAASLLFGAYGRTSSAPRELLPIVIDAR